MKLPIQNLRRGPILYPPKLVSRRVVPKRFDVQRAHPEMGILASSVRTSAPCDCLTTCAALSPGAARDACYRNCFDQCSFGLV